uniref:MULE transposase domain-containing protein n=1 Tax=Ditylenchus dipsaci TaxID=166011 RepID=A0A915CQN7_9BILA
MFAGIEFRPCFFHLQKSVIRDDVPYGSKELYDNNEAFRREVNLILALAFTPIEELSMAFTKLREYMEDSTFAEQMQPILDYFENSFTIVKWNVIKLVMSDEPRTSNSIEFFNGQLVRTIAASHPTIWKLIESLRNEFAISEQKCLQDGLVKKRRSEESRIVILMLV